MTQNLLLFSIGPVQSFIAQARKTLDLGAGSFLLSHLIQVTTKELEKNVNDCVIIFPHPEIESKPNRFIASFKSSTPEKVGQHLESFVKEELEKIAFDILEEIGISKLADFTKKTKTSLEKQLQSFLQIFWVALPYDKNNYSDSYFELEQSLGAIKNVQSFVQLKERGRKCSLCGERNVLFYKTYKSFIRKKEAVSLNDDILHQHFDDELCGICFTKRFLNWHFNESKLKNYPSTAKIILNNTIDNIDLKLVSQFEGLFGDEFDYQLYYEENLTENYFKKRNLSLQNLKKAKQLQKEIKKQAKEKGLSFSKYYSIVMFDGDNMGKWLSDAYHNDDKKLRSFHNVMSKKLGDYAESVSEIITKEAGKVVYAGGDDVLAFVNLDFLLPVLNQLRLDFPNFGDIPPKTSDKSTASCGVCISHYKIPLGRTLSWARRMERQAKDEVKNKDAVGFAYLRHSGAITKCLFKWDYQSNGLAKEQKTEESLLTLDTLDTLDTLATFLQKDYISSTFVRHLDMELRRLMDREGKYQEKKSSKDEKGKEQPGLVKTELRRLISRSCLIKVNNKQLDKSKNEVINELVEKLNILYENSFSLENFLSFLDIALLFERGIR
jgi:CRISPR-associated protein Cmr2